MLRSITETVLNEECPFYRPSLFHKFNPHRLPLQSKVERHNYTLPLESSIENLKLNNPFHNNISICSANRTSKNYNKSYANPYPHI